MTRYRPTGVLVIAILHLVFGGLGLVSDLCGLAMQLGGQQAILQLMPGPQAAQQKEMQAKIEAHLPGYRVIQVGEQVVVLVLDVMLLAAGIGLLSMRPWARVLSITYAFLSIANRIAITLYTVIFVMPAMSKLMTDLTAGQPGPNPMAGMMSTMMSMGSFMSIMVMFIYLAYPIAVLIVMFHPVTVRAFRGEYQEPGYEDERGRALPEGYDEPFGGEPEERYRPRDR